MFRQPRLTRTLRTIAERGPAAYYRGEIAQELARSVRAVGGLLSTDDLAAHSSNWVEPLSTRYRDVTVYELPPNSQGIIALLMLNVLQQLPAAPLQEGSAEYIHLLAEVARLAYADREAHLTDPEHMSLDPADLLTEEYARRRAALVREHAGRVVAAGTSSDTIYLCAADEEGNLVSLIESNFMGIGSGIMAGETGIMLQNRGAWFSLDPGHPNAIAPHKRTMHTLMPGMAFKGERPWLVFGTMGGSAQAQIHVQLLTRLIDQKMRLDDALDAPRIDAVPVRDARQEQALLMEDRFSPQVTEELRRRGHDVRLLAPYTSEMGHAHAIELLDNGAYVGASDPRTTSLALGY